MGSVSLADPTEVETPGSDVDVVCFTRRDGSQARCTARCGALGALGGGTNERALFWGFGTKRSSGEQGIFVECSAFFSHGCEGRCDPGQVHGARKDENALFLLSDSTRTSANHRFLAAL